MKDQNVFSVLLLACVLMVGGCAMAPDQGQVVRAVEVERLIESATVLPDHTYYFTGSDLMPEAIIALDNRFTLQSKYWVRVDDAAVKLREWNRSIDNAYRVKYGYEGAWILTPDGAKAGIWYSPSVNSFVQFPDPTTIILYTPIIKSERKRPVLNLFDAGEMDGF